MRSPYPYPRNHWTSVRGDSGCRWMSAGIAPSARGPMRSIARGAQYRSSGSGDCSRSIQIASGSGPGTISSARPAPNSNRLKNNGFIWGLYYGYLQVSYNGSSEGQAPSEIELPPQIGMGQNLTRNVGDPIVFPEIRFQPIKAAWLV